MKIVRSVVQKLALLLIVVPIIAVVFYFTIPLGNVSATHYDAILVFGYPTNPDGTPSAEQRERVLEAVRQYRAGIAPVMILSGGAAHNQFVEADAMGKLAESSGVPTRAIVEERRARNTIENVEYSTQILHTHGWDSVEAVTSAAHERRASLILMHAPFAVNWRVRAAPWPVEYSWLDIVARYTNEIFASAKMRIIGFQEIRPYIAPGGSISETPARNGCHRRSSASPR